MKKLQAGAEVTAVNINMGMAVMKEAGAQWLTVLNNKLRSENSIVINGFRKVGIVEAVQNARDGSLPDENLPPTDSVLDGDPFTET